MLAGTHGSECSVYWAGSEYAADAKSTTIIKQSVVVSFMYTNIVQSITQITEGETNLIANCANTASILYNSLPDVNWAGFYMFDGVELVLGPFHGKPACIRIAMGRGVCGWAAAERLTVVVPDFAEFPGHIACDADSRSEIVIPLVRDNMLMGVMDLDSTQLDRFTDDDARGLEQIAAVLMSRLTS